MTSSLIALVSMIVAIAAVAVAVWQVHAARTGVDRTNSLPVISKAFDEFRSETFQAHLREIWNNAPADVPPGGFQGLERKWRTSAYTVAYFFEYLGVLVAYELVPEEFVIDFSANMIVRTWNSLEPFIVAEREYRQARTAHGVSPGFVSHFEHLVALTLDDNGNPIDAALQRQINLKSLPR